MDVWMDGVTSFSLLGTGPIVFFGVAVVICLSKCLNDALGVF